MSWLHGVLKSQYLRAMRNAYDFARGVSTGGEVLDCGSGDGHELSATFGAHAVEPGFHYLGLEWSAQEVERGRSRGIDIVEADLNRQLPVATASQDCVIAYSVLEHLLMPCSFLCECKRVLRPGGTLVVLTPNISTYFTALQVLLGRMPTSGPHPDSNQLLELEQPARMTVHKRDDVTGNTPMHRHLVVFSFKSLRKYLRLAGFEVIEARGFGYYPFPAWLQPLFEKADPSHCHQMVFVCRKPAAP